MSTYWTNFAKTGDPNGAGVAAWPAYDPIQERYLVLDDTPQAAAAYHVAQCGVMDTLPEPNPSCTSICHFYTVAQWWHRRTPN